MGRPEDGTCYIVFVPVILGTQILRGIESTSLAHYLEAVTRSYWAAFAVILLAATILSHYFLIFAGNVCFGTLVDRSLTKSHLFMNAVIPLAFAFEFAYQLTPLLERKGNFFPVLGRQYKSIAYLPIIIIACIYIAMFICAA